MLGRRRGERLRRARVASSSWTRVRAAAAAVLDAARVPHAPHADWRARCCCRLLVLPHAAAAAGAASKAAKAAAKAVAKQDKRNAKLKEQRAAEAAAGGKKVAAALQSETEQFSKAIRGVKSRARALMQQGMPAKAAQAMARKAVTGGRVGEARAPFGRRASALRDTLLVWCCAMRWCCVPALNALDCLRAACATHRRQHQAPEEEAQDCWRQRRQWRCCRWRQRRRPVFR